MFLKSWCAVKKTHFVLRSSSLFNCFSELSLVSTPCNTFLGNTSWKLQYLRTHLLLCGDLCQMCCLTHEGRDKNGRHFLDDILVQIMAWRRPGYKSLSEPMMVSLLTYISINRPLWLKRGLSQLGGVVWVGLLNVDVRQQFETVAETTLAPFLQTTFSNLFSSMKIFNFDENLTEICSWWSNWQHVIIGSGNDLVPNRRQAIHHLNQWWPGLLTYICVRHSASASSPTRILMFYHFLMLLDECYNIVVRETRWLHTTWCQRNYYVVETLFGRDYYVMLGFFQSDILPSATVAWWDWCLSRLCLFLIRYNTGGPLTPYISFT